MATVQIWGQKNNSLLIVAFKMWFGCSHLVKFDYSFYLNFSVQFDSQLYEL